MFEVCEIFYRSSYIFSFENKDLMHSFKYSVTVTFFPGNYDNFYCHLHLSVYSPVSYTKYLHYTCFDIFSTFMKCSLFTLSQNTTINIDHFTGFMRQILFISPPFSSHLSLQRILQNIHKYDLFMTPLQTSFHHLSRVLFLFIIKNHFLHKNHIFPFTSFRAHE